MLPAWGRGSSKKLKKEKKKTAGGWGRKPLFVLTSREGGRERRGGREGFAFGLGLGP